MKIEQTLTNTQLPTDAHQGNQILTIAKLTASTTNTTR